MDFNAKIEATATPDGVKANIDGQGMALMVSAELIAARTLTTVATSKENLMQLKKDMFDIIDNMLKDSWDEKVAETEEQKAEARARLNTFIAMFMK